MFKIQALVVSLYLVILPCSTCKQQHKYEGCLGSSFRVWQLKVCKLICEGVQANGYVFFEQWRNVAWPHLLKSSVGQYESICGRIVTARIATKSCAQDLLYSPGFCFST